MVKSVKTILFLSLLICVLLGAIGAINSNEIVYERVKIVGHNGEILSDQSNGSPFFLNESGKVEFYQDLGLQEDGTAYVETLIAVPEGDEGTRYTTENILLCLKSASIRRR